MSVECGVWSLGELDEFAARCGDVVGLADGAFRADVVGRVARQLGVDARIREDVCSRAWLVVVDRVLAGVWDGSRGRFSSFVWGLARAVISRSAVRDEVRSSRAVPVADVWVDGEYVPVDMALEVVASNVDRLNVSRMRGSKRVLARACALRVAFGLPDVLRPRDEGARRAALDVLVGDECAGLRAVRAVREGRVWCAGVESVFARWDGDALEVVDALGVQCAQVLALSGVVDLPVPNVRRMGALVRLIVSAGDESAEWGVLAERLADWVVASQCGEFSGEDRGVLVEAAGFRGAPLGGCVRDVEDALVELLWVVVPVVREGELVV